MNYRQFENELLGPLQPLSADGIEVAVLPQVQAAFSKTFNARVFVGYGGSKYDRPTASDIVVQNEVVSVFVILQSRFLDSPNGIYALIERVKALLLGFQPQHTTRLYLSSIDFDKYEDNVWNYIVTFECLKMQTQIVQDWEPGGVPLQPFNVSYHTSVNKA